MAYPSQIEAAAKTQKAPVGGSYLTHDSPLLSMPARERTAAAQRRREEKEEEDRIRAGRLVRRVAPADAAVILDVLGLDESGDLVPPTAHKQCTRCEQTKPLDAFPFRSGARDRRCSHCIACKSADKRARYARRKEAGQ